MDNWQPSELKALAEWFPGLFTDLAAIFNYIEDTGEWPEAMMKAYISLIPKNSEATVKPTDLRPITVLSALYRLWAKVRFQHLLVWQEKWCDKQMWGCRPGHSAEAMALEIALDMEGVAFEAEGIHVGAFPMILKRLST